MKTPNRIRGGIGDRIPYSAVNKRQLRMGQKVEMEHTNRPSIAREIAKDHLVEFPDYYTHLNKMEKSLEKKKKKGWHKQPKKHRKAYYKGRAKKVKRRTTCKPGKILTEKTELGLTRADLCY